MLLTCFFTPLEILFFYLVIWLGSSLEVCDLIASLEPELLEEESEFF